LIVNQEYRFVDTISGLFNPLLSSTFTLHTRFMGKGSGKATMSRGGRDGEICG